VFKKQNTHTKDLKGLREGIRCSKNKKQIKKDLRGLREGIRCSKNTK